MPTSATVNSRERKRRKAREKLEQVTLARQEAEQKADALRRKQFRYVLKAHQSGLTYRECAAATGLTEIRIAQILRAEREAS